MDLTFQATTAFPASSEILQEAGYPHPEASPQPGRVPGDGAFAVPHYLSFSSLVNSVSRTYRWAHDEALRHSRKNALAMRRDPVIMSALRARQLPVAQLAWHLEGTKDEDSRQTEAIDGLTRIIEEIPDWQTLLLNLLEAQWYGRYAAVLFYAWDWSLGRKRMVIRDHRPLNGDKLVFKYSGQAGVLVNGQFRGSWEPTERGRAHFFTPAEREQLIIHHFEPEDADFDEGDMAGSIFGTGIRDRIYWFWFLRAQVFAFLMNYLERVGAGGLTIYYYEAGNPQSLADVKKAAEEQHLNNTILFPRYRDGTPGGPGVQRVETGTAGANLLQALVTSYFDDQMRLYILGQSLTSEVAATGLGSGVARLHGETRDLLIKYDAVSLQEALTRDLLRVLQKYNYPDAPPLRFRFDVDRPDALAIAQAAQTFYQLGGALSESQLRDALGLETPQPGEPILAQMGSLSPAPAMATPEGVPMEGQPGPEPPGTDPSTGMPVDPQALLAGLQMSRRRRRPKLRV